MATCVTPDTNGYLLLAPASTPNQCEAYVLLDVADYQLMVQSIEITPEQVLEVFGWGFGVVMLFWSLGFALGVAKGLINRA